jgi:hypothetical protein
MGVFALIFILLVGLIAAADVNAVAGVVRQVVGFRAAGASVLTLKAEQSVDGQRCSRLMGVGAITGAAALRPGQPVTLAAMPSSPVTGVEATPDLLALLQTIAQPITIDPGTSAGIWLSADVASLLQAQPGDTVPTSAGPVQVAAIYTWPDDGRGRDLGYAMVTPVAADGVFSQCWIETWPLSDTVTNLLNLSVINPNPDNPATINQLNTSLGLQLDGQALLDKRLTAQAGWVAGIAGLLLGFTATRSRRLEIADALHVGITRTALLWQQLLETVIWVTASLIIVAAALLWLVGALGQEPAWAIWLTGLRAVIAAAATTLLGALLGASSAREKNLAHYAKDR